jgi:hypothetical protein
MSLAPSGSESLALKRDPYTKPSIEEASSIPTLVSTFSQREKELKQRKSNTSEALSLWERVG